MMTQSETAKWMGYGDDIDAMNAVHDPLHEAVTKWLNVPSYALANARGETLTPEQMQLAYYEEDAILHLQRFMQHIGACIPNEPNPPRSPQLVQE